MSRFFTNRMSLEFKEMVYLLYAQICSGQKSATAGLFPPFNGHLEAMNLTDWFASISSSIERKRRRYRLLSQSARTESATTTSLSCHSRCDARAVFEENAKTWSDTSQATHLVACHGEWSFSPCDATGASGMRTARGFPDKHPS